MGHEIIDLDFDEMEIISQLRKLREHGWGSLTVTVQGGEVKVIRKEEITKCDEQRKIFEEVK
jgi:hypothetical protein